MLFVTKCELTVPPKIDALSSIIKLLLPKVIHPFVKIRLLSTDIEDERLIPNGLSISKIEYNSGNEGGTTPLGAVDEKTGEERPPYSKRDPENKLKLMD
jgi:hypothetical protein